MGMEWTVELRIIKSLTYDYQNLEKFKFYHFFAKILSDKLLIQVIVYRGKVSFTSPERKSGLLIFLICYMYFQFAFRARTYFCLLDKILIQSLLIYS